MFPEAAPSGKPFPWSVSAVGQTAGGGTRMPRLCAGPAARFFSAADGPPRHISSVWPSIWPSVWPSVGAGSWSRARRRQGSVSAESASKVRAMAAGRSKSRRTVASLQARCGCARVRVAQSTAVRSGWRGRMICFRASAWSGGRAPTNAPRIEGAQSGIGRLLARHGVTREGRPSSLCGRSVRE